MPENKIMENIIDKRQKDRKELSQTRDLRRYIKRKDMQPKKVQLSTLHYDLRKFKKRVILLENKLDEFDRRLIEMEDFIVESIKEEESKEENYKIVKNKTRPLPIKDKKKK